MRYYLILPEEKQKRNSDFFDGNALGFTDAFQKIFWKEEAFRKFSTIVEHYPKLLEEIEIRDEKNKVYNAESFLDILSKNKVLDSDR